MENIRLILAGLGHVNRGLLKIIRDREKEIAEKYNLKFKITAVADSTGVAFNTSGFTPDQLLTLKANGDHVIHLSDYSSVLRTEDFAGTGIGDILIESTPANMEDGSPGLQAARAALRAGIPVVFANKAPLALAFDELHRLADMGAAEPYHTEEVGKSKIAYSATVCGGLPVINVLQRDLHLAHVRKFRGILNATTNYILAELGKGGSFEEAVREAQRIGAAETDPAYDINGHDAANKLFIIAKTLGWPDGSVKKIKTKGIADISESEIEGAVRRNCLIKLVASAERQESGWKLIVQPEEVRKDSFLGTCNGWEMGFELESDLYDRVCMKNYEADPLGTSAAVLRDIINLMKN